MPLSAFRTFINRAIRLPMGLRYLRLKYENTRVLEYQELFLYETIADASETVYGKTYEFSLIGTPEEYMQQAPLNDYSTLEPYITRCLQGEQQVLTPYDIKRFAQTAGTTSTTPKFIPVTEESLQENHFKCSKDFLSMYFRNNPDTKILEGLGIVLAGGFTENPSTKEKNTGYISGILNKEKPRRGAYFAALDDTILSIKNRHEKMDRIVAACKDQSITSISGVGPRIVLLGETLLQKTGRAIHDIWPSFELILSGGVNIDLYKDQYKHIFGSQVNVYNMYNSSEGFYGFQVENNNHDLLLATTHGIFYEFIPMHAFAGTDSPTITLADVELGVDYAIVITTNAGLWRYILGDTVRFTSLDPFMIQVTGRTQLYCNAFGEQIRQFHIIHAMTHAAQTTGAVIKEYTVGPYFHEHTGGIECLVEFAEQPESHTSFIHEFDQALQAINIYYAPKRAADICILHPRLTTVPHGTFKRWLETKGKLGGQNKVPNLWNDRRYLDEILALL